MGLGCNAVGVTGCRIIDSRRERLAAILTNAFVPCNGRFPALIAIITMFVAGSGIAGTAVLFVVILCGVLVTFGVTWLLCSTLLRRQSSAFTLELPPFRLPDLTRIAVRSVFDRTVFVLGRAVSVAAPAGLVIWCLANLRFGNGTLLSLGAGLLEPVGVLLGVDGVFLLALLLGLPANEIVLSVAFMCYTAGNSLVAYDSLATFRSVLLSKGWDTGMAVCALILMLFHFPCATTLLTVRRETGSIRWMLLSAALPMAVGSVLAFSVNMIFRMF